MQITDEMVQDAAVAWAYHEGYVWGSSGVRHDDLRTAARAALEYALNGIDFRSAERSR